MVVSTFLFAFTGDSLVLYTAQQYVLYINTLGIQRAESTSLDKHVTQCNDTLFACKLLWQIPDRVYLLRSSFTLQKVKVSANCGKNVFLFFFLSESHRMVSLILEIYCIKTSCTELFFYGICHAGQYVDFCYFAFNVPRYNYHYQRHLNLFLITNCS